MAAKGKTKYQQDWDEYEEYIRECEANKVPVSKRLDFQQWQKQNG